MVAFSVIFGRLAKLPRDGVPYPLFAFCGLLPWQCFATALNASANSLVGNAALLSKVYFPRLVLPLAASAPAIVDLGVSLLALFALMAFYGVRPGIRWLLLPVLVLWPPVVALSAGLWLPALAVRYRDARYRDVRHALPFLMQLWMFVSPVVYPASLFPQRVRPWLGLDPVAGVVKAHRWALLGTETLDLRLVTLLVGATVVLLVSGALYFRRTERAFADVVKGAKLVGASGEPCRSQRARLSRKVVFESPWAWNAGALTSHQPCGAHLRGGPAGGLGSERGCAGCDRG